MAPEADTGIARRIADDLMEKIKDGVYPPGAKLPTARALAEEYGTTRTTAHKALAMLQRSNIAEARTGSGTYVRESHPVRILGPDRYARSRWADTAVEAYSPAGGEPARQEGSQTQTVRVVEADEQVAAALGLPKGTPVVERARMIYRNGRVTHTVASYYRQEHVVGTPIMDDRPGIAGNGGGFAVLAERGLEPHEITEETSARMPTSEEALILGILQSDPILEMHRVARTREGRPVEYARGVYIAHRFKLRYTFLIPD